MRVRFGCLLLWVACSGGGTTVPSPTGVTSGDTSEPTPTTPDPEALSSLGVVLGFDGSTFTYGERVQSYVLATPLFSDYAVKERAFLLPKGTTAAYTANGVLDFPVGTTIVKSFLFPADLRAPEENLTVIETRVLTREEGGWKVWPYLWNDEQTEAYRAPSGAVRSISLTGLDGEPWSFPYLVPQRNQCIDCHEKSNDKGRANKPIGPSARNLHVGDQLQRLLDAGVLSGFPALSEIGPAVDEADLHGVDPKTLDDTTLNAAARDYLDVNCAHCHNPDGTEGRSSQLFLNWDNTDPFNLGVCKKPGSAGRGTGGFIYDIVPGEPERSILWYRIQTAEVGEMMPDIGRILVHDEGVALVAEWIARLQGTCEAEATP